MGYIYNFILLILSIILVYSRINRKRILYRTAYQSVGNFIYIFFFLVFLYSLYTGFGGDNQRYQDFVEGGYLDFFDSEFYSFEKLYVIIAMYTQDFLIWKICVYGAAVILTLISIKRMKADNELTLLAFALIPMASYGATRAVLAYSIFLLGYTYLNDNKRYKQIIGIAIILLSWNAHSSMILPILLTPLTYLKITKARLYALLAIFPLVVVLFNKYYLTFWDTFFIEDSLASGKFESYTEGGYATDVSTIGTVLRFYFGCLLIPPVIIGIRGVYNNSIERKYHKICKLSFFMVYMCFVLYFSTIDNNTFFNRYFNMIPFFLYLAISGISLEKSITPIRRNMYMHFVLLYVLLQQSYNLYCAYFV